MTQDDENAARELLAKMRAVPLEERRRLARLPYEEKILIALQMSRERKAAEAGKKIPK